MDFNAQLELLKTAQGDPAKLALASVDLLLSARPAEERRRVREGLEAAVVPHWFDEKILAALLEISESDAVARLVRLRELTVVEPHPVHGAGVMNVHETIRVALRAHLTAETPERFRALSARANGYFSKGHHADADVEALYHRFTTAPEKAVHECGDLFDRWTKEGNYEALLALASSLEELLGPERKGLPAGLVRGAALHQLGRIRQRHRRLADNLETIRALAQDALTELLPDSDDWHIAGAHNLLGFVLNELHDFDEALVHFKAALKIRRALATAHPADGAAQRNLANAYTHVGDVLLRKAGIARLFCVNSQNDL